MQEAFALLANALAEVGKPGGGRHGGGGTGDDGGGPKFPPYQRFEGPWLQQQLILSLGIGISSFLLFSYVRRRSPALFAPRTKLAGYAPYAKGIDDGAFSWIWPTLKTEEVKILHIVGLDAAILLSFFKTAFWIFALLSIWSCVVLMPVNYHNHGTIDGVAPSEEPQNPDEPSEKLISDWLTFTVPDGSGLPWTFHLPSITPYHFTHLVSTYVFTALILRALYKGFNKFVRSRQLYALDLLQSIPARTVEVRNLPTHLQKERNLAEYFEAMGFAVESTAVVREVRGLKDVLAKRVQALYKLEKTWCKWLDNPTTAEYYDADEVCRLSSERAPALAEGGEQMVLAAHGGLLSSADDERARLLGTSERLPDPAYGIVAPKNRKRPTMRISAWNPFGRRVDAITLLEARFRALDGVVHKLREKGSPPSTVGFVTFVDAMSAQIVAQSVHYPIPTYCKTTLAPEPRDIIWSNVAIPSNERRLRQLLVSAFTFALFVFYVPPLTFLASLLSPPTIKKYLPSLYKLLKKNDRLMAFASTSLPSLVLISFNALLPLVLEWTAHLQGLKARSLVEFSVLKRYHLFLMISVIFIFLVTRTALGVLTDLAGNPMRIIDKLAQSLPKARDFSLSYVVFQSLAVIPLQLLQIPVTFGRAFGRLTARTPRQHAELNAPPQLYAGSVYPSALIVFTLCLVYSIISPLVTIFGAIYFALAYLVYKYKLLYVFYRSYESRGQAWPLSAIRCMWALVLFQIFQLSLFSVRKQLLMSTLMLPLIIFTLWFTHHLRRTFDGLSDFVSLSSIAEINKPSIPQGTDAHVSASLSTPHALRAMPSDQVANTAAAMTASQAATERNDKSSSPNPIVAMRTEALGSIDPSQTVLSRKRYAAKDDTLFVAQKDRHTDYREPPAAGYYYGTLNTGRRRYGHPALTAILPDFWPPVRVEEDEEKGDLEHSGSTTTEEGAAHVAAPAAEADATVDSAIAVSGEGSDRGSLLGVSERRTRRTSKPNEAVVVSLRRRKSSLLSNAASFARMSSLRGSRIRATPEGGAGQTSDAHADAVTTSPKAARQGTSSVTFPGRSTSLSGIADSVDESCPDPGHQHEDPSRIWASTSSSGKAAVGASGRAHLASTAEEDFADTTKQPDQHTSAHLENDESGMTADVAGENEEEEDDETEGVYMHRPARQDIPGSFPH